MARLISQAKAGYYPLDAAGFDDLASVLRIAVSADEGACNVLDPCAGRGEVVRLCTSLGRSYLTDWYATKTTGGVPLYRSSPREDATTLFACELEVSRADAAEAAIAAIHTAEYEAWREARAAKANAGEAAERGLFCRYTVDGKVARGDAFRLPVYDPFVHLLYLNPPYDHDDTKRGGRVESRWLERFSRSVVAGGVLAFVVPLAAVGECADLLARGWTDIQIGRVRVGAASAAFAPTQVIVLAQRVTPELAVPDALVVSQVQAAVAAGVGALPGVATLRRVDVPSTGHAPMWRHTWAISPLDLMGACDEHKPWMRSVRRAAPGARRAPPLAPLREALPDRRWSELTAREFPTLMPLKPSYVADAIASGALDGELVEPTPTDTTVASARTNASTLPPLRVKGMFDRRFREVEVKYNKDGEARASVQVQRPALRVSVLDPAGAVHVLGDSPIPSGSDDVSQFTVGDLVTRYGPSLAAALGRRCPVTGDADGVVVPPLRRTPFAAQAAAVRAVAGRLMRMAKDRAERGGPTPSALLQGEPGTGKTSMCLAVAKTIGARRVLVVCPPHLVAEEAAWQSDAAAVLGDEADVRVLETPVDVDRFADPGDDGRMRIGIASREVAKLGHGYEAATRCSRCGTIDPREPSKLTATRATCKAPALRPAKVGRLSQAAQEAARALAWCEPQDPSVGERLPPGSLAVRYRTLLAARPAAERPTAIVVEPAWRAIETTEEWCDAWSGKTMTNGVASLHKALTDATSEARTAMTELGHRARDPIMRLFMLLRSAAPLVHAGSMRRCGEGYQPGAMCGEPLWQAAPRPRRWPLVRSLVRAAKRGAFDLLVLDEAHEYGNYDSAQAQAAEQLVATGVPVILATGTVCNGYMSSMHAHFRVLSEDYARDFARGDRLRAVARFGYQRRQVDLAKAVEATAGAGADDNGGIEFGAVSDRIVHGAIKVVGQAPGVLPEALLRYLAPATAQVHLEDLGAELPPISDVVVEVEPTSVQADGLAYLAAAIKKQILADRRHKDRAGKLFGQFADLPSFLDRCSLRPEWVVSYPALTSDERRAGTRGPEVARLPYQPESEHASPILLPSPGEVLPKEQALVEWVAAQLRRGRPCLVYVWHWDLLPRIKQALSTGLATLDLASTTGVGRWCPRDPETDQRIAATTIRVDVLDPSKVAPPKREAWIAKAAARHSAVLLTNPAAVKTGINAIARWWPSAAWFEGPGCSPEIRRQATHRIYRIGQRRPVEVASFVYSGTMQATLHELLMSKVGVSEGVDGLDASAALQASGVGAQDASLSLEVGRALYEWCERHG